MATLDVSHLRREYTMDRLVLEDLDLNPFQQFQDWFTQACDKELLDVNAMCLATSGTDNRPMSRMVLLKYFDEKGFVFYTNFNSVKAIHIATNPNVSLLFFWAELGRQVQINGHATKVSTQESVKYFVTRPRGSQIGAWVSKQSSVISSRQMLEAKFDEMKRKFADGEVPLPSFWGGYRVMPETVEFWQGRHNRLHDRFMYRLTDNEWRIQQLAP